MGELLVAAITIGGLIGLIAGLSFILNHSIWPLTVEVGLGIGSLLTAYRWLRKLAHTRLSQSALRAMDRSINQGRTKHKMQRTLTGRKSDYDAKWLEALMAFQTAIWQDMLASLSKLKDMDSQRESLMAKAQDELAKVKEAYESYLKLYADLSAQIPQGLAQAEEDAKIIHDANVQMGDLFSDILKEAQKIIQAMRQDKAEVNDGLSQLHSMLETAKEWLEKDMPEKRNTYLKQAQEIYLKAIASISRALEIADNYYAAGSSASHAENLGSLLSLIAQADTVKEEMELKIASAQDALGGFDDLIYQLRQEAENFKLRVAQPIRESMLVISQKLDAARTRIIANYQELSSLVAKAQEQAAQISARAEAAFNDLKQIVDVQLPQWQEMFKGLEELRSTIDSGTADIDASSKELKRLKEAMRKELSHYEKLSKQLARSIRIDGCQVKGAITPENIAQSNAEAASIWARMLESMKQMSLMQDEARKIQTDTKQKHALITKQLKDAQSKITRLQQTASAEIQKMRSRQAQGMQELEAILKEADAIMSLVQNAPWNATVAEISVILAQVESEWDNLILEITNRQADAQAKVLEGAARARARHAEAVDLIKAAIQRLEAKLQAAREVAAQAEKAIVELPTRQVSATLPAPLAARAQIRIQNNLGNRVIAGTSQEEIVVQVNKAPLVQETLPARPAAMSAQPETLSGMVEAIKKLEDYGKDLVKAQGAISKAIDQTAQSAKDEITQVAKEAAQEASKVSEVVAGSEGTYSAPSVTPLPAWKIDKMAEGAYQELLQNNGDTSTLSTGVGYIAGTPIDTKGLFPPDWDVRVGVDVVHPDQEGGNNDDGLAESLFAPVINPLDPLSSGGSSALRFSPHIDNREMVPVRIQVPPAEVDEHGLTKPIRWWDPDWWPKPMPTYVPLRIPDPFPEPQPTYVPIKIPDPMPDWQRGHPEPAHPEPAPEPAQPAEPKPEPPAEPAPDKGDAARRLPDSTPAQARSEQARIAKGRASARTRPNQATPTTEEFSAAFSGINLNKFAVVDSNYNEEALKALARIGEQNTARFLETLVSTGHVRAPPQALLDAHPLLKNIFERVFGVVYIDANNQTWIFIAPDLLTANNPETITTFLHEAIEAYLRSTGAAAEEAHNYAKQLEQSLSVTAEDLRRGKTCKDK